MTKVSGAERPIIPGFYPDPTVCRVGDYYYLATSSFEYFPGAPLFRSTDLVTWKQIGHILTTREQFVEGDSRPSMGIYGSTLRHHRGLFYFITTNVNDYDSGQVIVTARDPRGPWSSPLRVPDAIGIDPDLCWDDSGQCLLTWKYLDFGRGAAGIRQAPLDLATGELKSEPYALWQGSGNAHAEGPHLHRVGRWWYLLLAEGGTERGHCVTVARSDRPDGGFEAFPDNPVLTRRSSARSVQSVGHADLVEAPDGRWAIVHLGTRPRGSTPSFHVLGRETFLAGVRWQDDWPIIDEDRFMIPATDTAFRDDFSDATLDQRWVVPKGDLKALRWEKGVGLTVPPGSTLCARVRDLRWEAEAVLAGVGAFEVRIDPKHAYGVRVADGVATAFMRVGGVTADLHSSACERGVVTIRISAVDPAAPPLILGDAGPDDIVLSVATTGAMRELARMDGRYLSTEVAAGFTGRMLALGSQTEPSRVRSVVYQPAL